MVSLVMVSTPTMLEITLMISQKATGKNRRTRQYFYHQNGKNRLTYQFQTGIEMKAASSTTIQNVRFACGVFRNGALVAVRPDRIASNNNSGKAGLQDYIFTLNYTEQNVPVGFIILKLHAERLIHQVLLHNLQLDEM